jgi:hypothetical protein
MGFRVFSLNTVQFGGGRFSPFGAPTPTGSEPAKLGSEGGAWAAASWVGAQGREGADHASGVFVVWWMAAC